MTDAGRSGGLGIIFSFFLGLMVAVFVGVGVYTFIPPPETLPELDTEMEELDRREQAIWGAARTPSELTAADSEELRELDVQRKELREASQLLMRDWGQTTSIVVIAFATLVMALSLIGADRLPVISNGLLLGGVFTMLYGVGWISATGMAMSRFIVITVALVITLGLGYIRFVRGRSTAATAKAPASTGATDASDIERRVRDLELRISEAAKTLGRSGSSSEGSE